MSRTLIARETGPKPVGLAPRRATVIDTTGGFQIPVADVYSGLADARKFAAADEMKAALRGLLDCHEYRGNGVWRALGAPTNAALTRAADALAKAEGDA